MAPRNIEIKDLRKFVFISDPQTSPRARALMELGVDTEMVRFPDENHELSRSGKPKHREERFRHILRWFDKYLT